MYRFRSHDYSGASTDFKRFFTHYIHIIVFLLYLQRFGFFFFVAQFSDKCFFDQDRGNCSKSMSKYFYDKNDGLCKQFVYSGCGGNENRFDSKQECNDQCDQAQSNNNNKKTHVFKPNRSILNILKILL